MRQSSRASAETRAPIDDYGNSGHGSQAYNNSNESNKDEECFLLHPLLLLKYPIGAPAVVVVGGSGIGSRDMGGNFAS